MEEFLDRIFLWLTNIYLAKGKHRTVVICGSIGKTSTTQAIATVLGAKYKVLATKKNYNTHRGVALSVFEQSIPTSRIGWVTVIFKCFVKAIFNKINKEILVLELGTDKPGDIAKFGFLSADLAVITAITPEHMEFFKSLQNVAREELSVSMFSDKLLVNSELVSDKFIKEFCPDKSFIKYGTSENYRVVKADGSISIAIGEELASVNNLTLAGHGGEMTLCASAAVAHLMGMNISEIEKGLASVRAIPGRMSLLNGIGGSRIIDDTYNSSPEAVRIALDYLYEQSGKRIALLGSMNEMGDMSDELHTMVGKWCDPTKIDLLVTIGKQANDFLAKAAEDNGCDVYRAENARNAGEYLKDKLGKKTVLLAKGSQNGVYAEEALKLLLADKKDVSLLTRQDTYWPKKKADYWVKL